MPICRLGESCSHVAAILFKLEAAVRLGYTQLTCTEQPCVWNDYHTDHVTPARIKDIRFFKDDVVAKVLATADRGRPTANLCKATDDEQLAFMGALSRKASCKPVVLSMFCGTSTVFKRTAPVCVELRLPRSLRSNYCAGRTLLPDELAAQAKLLRANLSISGAVNDYLESSTRSQANCIVWHEQRAGRITASNAHVVLHTNPESPAPSVMKSITTLKVTPMMAPALVYGRENESQVFTTVEGVLSTWHTNSSLRPAGMRISEKFPWLSASADGIIKCECHSLSLLEIKCPYTARDTPQRDIVADSSHYMFEGRLRRGHRYYTQVQLQMYVYDTTLCEFVVLVGDGLMRETIRRDDAYIDGMLLKLDRFWVRHVAPELITRAVENRPATASADAAVTTGDELYCYCRQPAEGRMF